MSKFTFKSNSTQYILLLTFIIAVLSFTLHPVVKKQFFGRKLWINYLDHIQSLQSIDPQEFWKTREFSDNGSIIFSRNGIDTDLIPRDISAIYNIIDTEEFSNLPFLLFQSNTLNSLDILIDASFLSRFDDSINSSTLQTQNLGNNIYFINDTKQKLTYLVFLKTSDSLRQANGFFDYIKHDKNIDFDKVWLNITSYRNK